LKTRTIDTTVPERALLVQVIIGNTDRAEAEESLAELERLADTAGAEVVGAISQRRDKPTPSFYIGEGKLAEIQLACRNTGANLIIFDNDLSPAQVNNLDMALGIKTIDRTELILQIFARRARSAEAKAQVELAQLQYLISRIPISVKQARFRGGIGMRGPGETPLQLRNEPMRRRIRELQKQLELLQRRREQSRKKNKWPLVCLVGYTNAGKSTLLNTLAHADAFVDDMLFATLDTKTRLLYIDEKQKVLLTDTVGFIRNLPHTLIASFKSTLDVTTQADVLLIVVDASYQYALDHLKVVHQTLAEIGADKVPSIILLNKIDNPSAQTVLPELLKNFPDAIQISALKKIGLDRVKQAIAQKLNSNCLRTSY
jgi:GTP-binding protein HflX